MHYNNSLAQKCPQRHIPTVSKYLNAYRDESWNKTKKRIMPLRGAQRCLPYERRSSPSLDNLLYLY